MTRALGEDMIIKDLKVGNFLDDKIMLKDIVHVCMVVRNVEKTAKALAKKFGIGPFEIRQKTYPKSHATMRG